MSDEPPVPMSKVSATRRCLACGRLALHRYDLSVPLVMTPDGRELWTTFYQCGCGEREPGPFVVETTAADKFMEEWKRVNAEGAD